MFAINGQLCMKKSLTLYNQKKHQDMPAYLYLFQITTFNYLIISNYFRITINRMFHKRFLKIVKKHVE
jgi:hypothetical protein